MNRYWTSVIVAGLLAVGGVVWLVLSRDATALTHEYANRAFGISFRYPEGYTIDELYRYDDTEDYLIPGVMLTVPESLAQGTTLGSDTALTIERPTKPSACTANLYLDGSKAIPVVDAGTAYSVASSTDAAAGNRYEEWAYALPGANPCVVVRYFIHTTVFENYPPGAVRRFDTSALRNIFDEVRRTLIVTPYTYDQNRRGA